MFFSIAGRILGHGNTKMNIRAPDITNYMSRIEAFKYLLKYNVIKTNRDKGNTKRLGRDTVLSN